MKKKSSDPNPVSNTLVIEFSEDLASDLNLQLIDVTGRTLRKQQLLKGDNLFQLEVFDFPSALYFIKITDNSGQDWHYKFVKQ